MKDICNGTKWTSTEKEQFNYCRIYLRVELLSDIMTADGKAIRTYIWKGSADKCHEFFGHKLYEQKRPGNTVWTLWRKNLRHTYQCNESGIFSTSQGPISVTHDWKWFLDTESERIYQRQTYHWLERSRVASGRRTRQMVFGPTKRVESVPDNLLPITTYSAGDMIKIDGKGRPNRMSAALGNRWFSTTMSQVEGQVDTLVECMLTQQIVVMSDGSLKDDTAGASWIITTANAYDNG
jgi:hypothetical protein